MLEKHNFYFLMRDQGKMATRIGYCPKRVIERVRFKSSGLANVFHEKSDLTTPHLEPILKLSLFPSDVGESEVEH